MSRAGKKLIKSAKQARALIRAIPPLSEALRYDPYQFEEGDRVKLSDKISHARHSHLCAICWGLIAPGRPQRVMREKFDGQVQSFHICLVCCRAMIGHHEDGGKRIESRWGLGQQRARDFYASQRGRA